jgi:integrase
VLGRNGERPKVKSPNTIFREGPKRKQRAGFARDAWPEALKRDWQGYFEWKTKAFLSPEEGERFRSKRCKANSIEAHARRINPMVGYCATVLGKTGFDLNELCQTSLYTAYLNWYLGLDAGSGHHLAKDTGTTLATISQYLVAQGRLPQAGSNGKSIWNEFYSLSYKPLEVGAERASLPEPKSIVHWKPRDLVALADQVWDKEAPRYWRGDGAKRQKQLFARKRSGLFFALAYETPLRARNFLEMRWEHNLKKLPDGRWQVLFRGQELKVARRGVNTNEYRHTYSTTTSRFIDRWREELKRYVGADFETRCPYVFVASTPTSGPMTYQAFKTNIANLVMELRGETFNPHLVRHIVASYLVNEHGPGGLGLAAELLGDTVKVVLDTYYRPNTQQTLQDYLKIREGKN